MSLEEYLNQLELEWNEPQHPNYDSDRDFFDQLSEFEDTVSE